MTEAIVGTEKTQALSHIAVWLDVLPLISCLSRKEFLKAKRHTAGI